jgi:guanylate kinase
MLRIRVGKAVLELDYEARFDVVLVNDVLSNALDKAEQLVSDFLQ